MNHTEKKQVEWLGNAILVINNLAYFYSISKPVMYVIS
jgi:hypothetical protein